jgi:hypothetical protein
MHGGCTVGRVGRALGRIATLFRPSVSRCAPPVFVLGVGQMWVADQRDFSLQSSTATALESRSITRLSTVVGAVRSRRFSGMPAMSAFGPVVFPTMRTRRHYRVKENQEQQKIGHHTRKFHVFKFLLKQGRLVSMLKLALCWEKAVQVQQLRRAWVLQ